MSAKFDVFSLKKLKKTFTISIDAELFQCQFTMFLLITLASCAHLRDRLIGEWLISDMIKRYFPAYTLECHPGWNDALNATLWRDDIPVTKSFNFDVNPLVASAQIDFESDEAGSVFVSGHRVARFEYSNNRGFIEFDTTSYVITRVRGGFEVTSGMKKLFARRALTGDSRDLEEHGLIARVLQFGGLERFTEIVYVIVLIIGAIMGYKIVRASLEPHPDRLAQRMRPPKSVRKRDEERPKID